MEYGVGLLNFGDLKREQGQLDEAQASIPRPFPYWGTGQKPRLH
jgi:hypothetical protein